MRQERRKQEQQQQQDATPQPAPQPQDDRPQPTPAPTEAAPAPQPAPEAPQPATPPAEGEAAPQGQSGAERMRQERQRQQGQQGQQGEPSPAADTAPMPAPPQIQPPPARERPAPPVEAQQPAQGGEQAGSPLPENAAPILDSAKPAPSADRAPQTLQDGQIQPPQQQAQPSTPPPPPPTSDAAAQAAPIPMDRIRSVREERGQRIDVDRDRPRRWERAQGVDVVREVDNRIILNLGGGETYVESSDRPRLSRDARDVYYEELPRGRTREVIERPDGTQVITIRNAYGDVVRRSRIMPDNREYVLSYVDEEDWDDLREWRDPGEDLPPLRLTIPARDYILDAGTVDEPDRYYDFLDQPPVEQIKRLYSVDEVKRSARIRDTVRRVDLDTLTFATGSAEIADSQIDRLQGVAEGMLKLLERNPAETFLIEGHTDAVGSDQSNLVLSDRRAEGVADALTRYFNIPPENLSTQGYGERYLKINTALAEEQNRRVAIRRITPLVSPASASR